MPSRRGTWTWVRLAIYLVVVVVLFLTRAGGSWRRVVETVTGRRDLPAPALTVAGRDLAPPLVDRLLASYGQDYPDLAVTALSGGTNQALEDLLNRRADAAFLYRRPTAAEQELFRQEDGDTAIVLPVAIGTVLVLAAATDTTTLTPAGLADILAGGSAGPGLIYVPDPNEGVWDAVRERLGLAQDLPPAGSPVAFLADPAAVVAAVSAVAGGGTAAPSGVDAAWGLVSSLDAPVDPDAGAPPGLRFLPARAAPDSAACAPTYEDVAHGRYPLHHELFIACRADGDPQGAKFVTLLTSARGQRQIERAGVLPARQVAREIQLSRDPVGE